MTEQELNSLLEKLAKLPKETEWVAFKLNFHSAEERIIRDTLESKIIKEDDPESTSRKYAKYIPFWA